MEIKAAVGAGTTTCSTWTTPGTRPTMNKVPPAAFSDNNIRFSTL
jgi:hypothetical protein